MTGFLINANEVERLTECFMCLGRIKDAVVLPCQHTLCKTPCLQQLYDGDMSACPQCRAEFTKEQVKPCFFLNNLIEALQSPPTTNCPSCVQPADNIEVCQHCDKMMCIDCRNRHEESLKNDVLEMSSLMIKDSGIVLEKLSSDLAISMSQNDQMRDDMSREMENFKIQMVSQISQSHRGNHEGLMKIMENEERLQVSGEIENLSLQLNDLEARFENMRDYCDIDRLADLDCEVGRLQKIFYEQSQSNFSRKTSGRGGNDASIRVTDLDVNPIYKFFVARIRETPMLAMSITPSLPAFDKNQGDSDAANFNNTFTW